MFIPFKDNLKSLNFPIITTILIALNCGVFWFATSDPISNYSGAILFGLIPYEVTHAGIQCVPVDSVNNMVCGTPQYIHSIYPGLTLPSTMLTIVSSMFLHGGLGHLLGNMLYLFVFGRSVEAALGRWSYLMVYLIAGVAADLGQTLWNLSSTVPLIGASGAIAGVMGAYLVMFPAARITSLFIIIPCRAPAWLVVGSWILLQFWAAWEAAGAGASGGIAVFAHIAGFSAGAALAYYAVGTEKIAEYREMARAFTSGAPIQRPDRERVAVGPGLQSAAAAQAMAAQGQPQAPAPGQPYVAPPPQQYVAPAPPPAPPAPPPGGLTT